MKNIIDIMNEVTNFIVGKEESDSDKKIKTVGFDPKTVKKKRKYTKRKKKL